MSEPALPPVAGNIAAWIRKAATTVNLLITKAGGYDTSIAALDTTVSGHTTTIGAHSTAIAALQAPVSVAFVPQASAPATPTEGLTYYDGTLHKLRCYDGTAWNDLW